MAKPKQARSQKTYDDIVGVADELFGLHGYESTKMSEIIERSGAGPGSLYRFFPDKRAIAAAVVASYHTDMQAFAPLLEATTTKSAMLDLMELIVLITAQHQDSNPGYREAASIFDVHDPASPLGELRARQIDLVLELVDRVVGGRDPQQMRRVADYVAEMINALLNMKADPGDSREAQVAEVQRMVRSYVASVLDET